jgi:hypothetical protein
MQQGASQLGIEPCCDRVTGGFANHAVSQMPAIPRPGPSPPAPTRPTPAA